MGFHENTTHGISRAHRTTGSLKSPHWDSLNSPWGARQNRGCPIHKPRLVFAAASTYLHPQAHEATLDRTSWRGMGFHTSWRGHEHAMPMQPKKTRNLKSSARGTKRGKCHCQWSWKHRQGRQSDRHSHARKLGLGKEVVVEDGDPHTPRRPCQRHRHQTHLISRRPQAAATVPISEESENAGVQSKKGHSEKA